MQSEHDLLRVYKILRIDKNATPEDIKSVHRNLARKHTSDFFESLLGDYRG
jgi:DnaJ-class molecular chaperone